MENNKNKKSVKFQGVMLNFYDFIQVFVFTTNHHLNEARVVEIFNVRLAGDHLYGKWLFTWLSLVMYLIVSYFVLSLSHELSWLRSGT